MNRRTIVAACLLATLSFAGCAKPVTAPTPAPKPLIQETPIANPSASDKRLIKELVTPVQFDARNKPVWVTTTVPDVPTARREFPLALFPTDTAGRKLVAIVLEKATQPGAFPTAALRLVYQDGLTINEPADGGEGTGGGFHRPDLSQEATTVAGGLKAQVRRPRTFPEQLGTATVTWMQGQGSWSVNGPRLSKADVVRIARSLVK